MSLTVTPDLIASTKSPLLESYRQDAGRADRDQVIDTAKLNDEGMSDLINAAQSVQDNKTARALESILLARRASSTSRYRISRPFRRCCWSSSSQI